MKIANEVKSFSGLCTVSILSLLNSYSYIQKVKAKFFTKKSWAAQTQNLFSQKSYVYLRIFKLLINIFYDSLTV